MSGTIKSSNSDRLTILDLFLLTTFIAIFVGLYYNIFRTLAAQQGSGQGLDQTGNLITLLQAVECGVFCFLLYQLWKLRAISLAPGHWLIGYFGIGSLSQLLSYAVIAIWSVSSGTEAFSWYYAMASLVFSCLAWHLALVAAIKNKVCWRLVFILLLIPFSAFDFFASMRSFTPVLRMLFSFVLPFAIYTDIKTGVDRDWLHWVGVLLGVISLFVWPIYFVCRDGFF